MNDDMKLQENGFAEVDPSAPHTRSLAERLAKGRLRRFEVEVGGTTFRFAFDKELYSRLRLFLGTARQEEAPHQNCVEILLAAVESIEGFGGLKDLGLKLSDPDHWDLALDLLAQLASEMVGVEEISLGKPKRIV
ncbi:MAG: hypothetical protein RRB13_11845 [bacterium]|nr:hypothetical protein [bacterium]